MYVSKLLEPAHEKRRIVRLCCEYDLSLFLSLDIEFPDVETLQAHAKEAIILAHACNLNVLPFYGLYVEKKKLCIVTPWIENGDVMSYLRHISRLNRREDKPLLVCLLPRVSPFQILMEYSQIADTVSGLKYLHGMDIVHADLRGVSFSPEFVSSNVHVLPE
jgi:serine/threonine protein kinase